MSASAIDILDNDILLSIFDTITAKIPLRKVRQIDRPLATIRVASQVCQRWRALLLASPWIWGRLIDLQGVYDQQKREWIEEVARRSGSTAPLWIYGKVNDPPSGSLTCITGQGQCFIQRLESWERVEKLSVLIETRNKALLDYLRIRFLSPAPILELFDVYFWYMAVPLYLDTLQSGPSQRLFADYAPSLRRIKANKVAYRLDSPWLSNIREICPFPYHLTSEDIFAILQRTPSIERISIRNRDLLWVQPPFSRFNLLKLSWISLCTSLSVAAGILNHIAPGILTSFYMDVRQTQTEPLNLPYILSSFKKNLPSYISNYFTANSPRTLFLQMTCRSFRLCDVITDVDDGSPQHFEVSINTSFLAQHDWDNLVACLLDAFTASTTLQGNSSLFGSITELRLYFFEFQPALLPKLYSTFALLRHVKDIYVYAHARFALVDKAGDSDILFPQLHTLNLSAQATDTANDSMFVGLTQFMTRRKKLGFPIAKLDLTKCRGSKGKQDLCDLEGLDGLEVVWVKNGEKHGESGEICSYVCGTGEPERLKGLI